MNEVSARRRGSAEPETDGDGRTASPGAPDRTRPAPPERRGARDDLFRAHRVLVAFTVGASVIEAAILTFVGLKMLLYKWISLPTGTSLLIIAGILGIALIVSWLRPAPDNGD